MISLPKLSPSRCSGSMTEPPSLYAWYLGALVQRHGVSTSRIPGFAAGRLETSQGHLSLGEQTPTSLKNFHSKHRALENLVMNWEPWHGGPHKMVENARGTWGYFTYRGLMVNYNPHLQLVTGPKSASSLIAMARVASSDLAAWCPPWHVMRACHDTLFLLAPLEKKTIRRETKKANCSILKMLFLLIGFLCPCTSSTWKASFPRHPKSPCQNL